MLTPLLPLLLTLPGNGGPTPALLASGSFALEFRRVQGRHPSGDQLWMLELRRNGIGAVVLERGVFGIGASTRNGGMLSGGTNVAKGLGGKNPKVDAEFEANKAAFLGSGADSLQTLIDIIGREKIDCGLITNGRFTGAWTPAHYDDQARKVEMFNKYANVGAEMIPRERVREMMASDYYYGGMYVKAGGNLHPARYYKGLLEAAHRQGAILCGNVEAERTCGHGLDFDRLLVLAQSHDRAFAKGALDLGEGGIKGLGLVHGVSFHEAEIRLAHGNNSFWHEGF